MDYTNPYIPEEDKVQEVAAKIDPLANIRMTNPETGETVWAPNHMVDSAVESGWDFFNPEADVPVYAPSGKSTYIKAKDLSAAQGQGYGYKGYKQEQYDSDMQSGKLARDAMGDTTLVEDVLTAGSAVGRGMTFGLSDLISTGIIEGMGSLGIGGYEKGDSEEIYQLRELSPTLATSAEILGGFISAGGITKLGAQTAIQSSLIAKGIAPSLARVAASVTSAAAEGAAYGFGTTTADYVMDKPEVTADTILFNTGLGGAFGLLGAGAFEVVGMGASKVMSGIKKARQNRMSNLPETMPPVALDPMNVSETNQFYQNVFDPEGNKVATVIGSFKDPQGIHRGARNGVAIDKILVSENPPSGLRESVINSLLDEHPVVFTRKGIGEIDEPTETLFRNMGTKISSKANDVGYYGIFDKIDPDPAVLSAAKAKEFKMQKFFGRVPKEKQDVQLYDKFLNNPNFHNKVMDFYENPETLIRQGIRFIDDINKNRKAMTAGLEEARNKMIGVLDDEVMDVVRYNAIDLQTSAKNIVKKYEGNPDLYQSRSVVGISNKVLEDVERVVYTSDPGLAFKTIRELRQVVDEEIQALGRGRTSNLLQPLVKQLRQLERDVVGDFSEVYAKIQKADSNLIKADQAFTKSFLDKLGEVDESKIFSSFSVKSPGTAIKKAWAEQRMLGALEDADLALKDTKKRLNVNVEGFNPKIYSKRTITDLQETRAAAVILKRLEGGDTAIEKAVEGVSGSLGAMGTIAAVGGGPAGTLMFGGMYAAKGLVSLATGKAKSPLAQFSRIREGFHTAQAQAQAETRSVIRSAINMDNIKGGIKGLVKASRRTGTILGIKDTDTSTREERLNKIIESIDRQYSPSAINLLVNQAEENIPGMGPVIKNKIESGLAFIKDAAPPQPNGLYQKITKDQEEKFSEAVEIVFDPTTAFKRAVASGDVLTLGIILERYPEMASEIAQITLDELNGKELDKLSMRQKRVVKVLTNGMMEGSDQAAQKTNQGIYAALRGKEAQEKEQGGVGRPRTMKPMESQKGMTSSQRMQTR